MTDSTIEYYHLRKKALLKTIHPDAIVECQASGCFKRGYEDTEYHVHHIDSEREEHLFADGGWQRLYIYERDVAEDRELRVLCKECHLKHHNQEELID